MCNLDSKIISRLCAIFVLALIPHINSYGQTDSLSVVKPYVTDVRELLTGQTPGVVTVSSVGAPWMIPTVYVRGMHLYNQNPLYYVDGVLVHELGFLAPESIQDIDVLSGAEAIMRYGPEAVNGVLAITTKKASRSGFHISYGFSGAIQQLAWEPEQVTLEEWKQYRPLYYGLLNISQNPNLLDRYKTSFAQTHHLDLQYGQGNLRFAAGIDFLDNDGPLEGRNDSKKRYSGNADIDYRPMDWLRVNLSFAAGRSDIYYWNCLKTILNNEPVWESHTPENPLAAHDNNAVNNVQTGQALVEVLPLPGLRVKAFYGLNRDSRKADSYFLSENSYGFNYDWAWNQYGLESDYSLSFDKHYLIVGVSYKNQDYTYSGDYSSPYASSVSKYSFRRLDTYNDLSSKINYNWDSRLFLGVGVYQRWWKNQVQPRLPSLAADIRWDSGKNWSLFASWSQFYSHYYNTTFPSHPSFILDPAKYSRIDAGAEASVALGGNKIDFLVEGFLDNDCYYLEGSGMDIDNSGLEASVELSGQSGELRYNAGASLTLYHNKVKSMYPTIKYFKYHESLMVQEGYPIGIAWLKPLESIDRETGIPRFGDQQQAFGNGIFPTSSIGLHGSVAWRSWQLTVNGHGNLGQSVLHPHSFDALTRHYLENSWLPENKEARYPEYGWYGEVCRSSAALLNASFFRIDQIRLDYTLPIKRFNGAINMFASLENYFLFTSYPGSDPEYLLDWDNSGVETGSYPSTKRIVTGLKISF